MASDTSDVENDQRGENRNGFVAFSRSKRKPPHYYTDYEDLNILKEVVSEKATLQSPAEKWRKIYDAVDIPVKDYVAIKTRFSVLVNAFKKDEIASLRGSGREEDFNEKKQLLTEIVSQLQDWTNEEADKPGKSKKKDESQNRAQAIRAASLNTLTEDGDSPTVEDETTPKRRRISKGSDLLEIIKGSEQRESEKQDAKIELEKKRLELMEREVKIREDNEAHRRLLENRQQEIEERRLHLEERRLEAEEKRSEEERKERALLLSLLKNKK